MREAAEAEIAAGRCDSAPPRGRRRTGTRLSAARAPDGALARPGLHGLYQVRPGRAARGPPAGAGRISWFRPCRGRASPACSTRSFLSCRNAPFEYDAEDLGVQPLRFFVVEYLREAAFEQLSDELPYSFTAEVDEFREGSDPVYIRATLFVERNSQKGILIGENGRTIKAIGRHARMRLEQLMGQRVYPGNVGKGAAPMAEGSRHAGALWISLSRLMTRDS